MSVDDPNLCGGREVFRSVIEGGERDRRRGLGRGFQSSGPQAVEGAHCGAMESGGEFPRQQLSGYRDIRGFMI